MSLVASCSDLETVGGVVDLSHRFPPVSAAGEPGDPVAARAGAGSLPRLSADRAAWTSQALTDCAAASAAASIAPLSASGIRTVSRAMPPSSSSGCGGSGPLRGTVVDEPRVAPGNAELCVAGRELFGQLERAVAEDVEEAELERRFDRARHPFERGGERLVGRDERLQVSADRLEMRGEIHAIVPPSDESGHREPPAFRHLDISTTPRTTSY